MIQEDLEKEYDREFFKDPVFSKLVNRNVGISIAISLNLVCVLAILSQLLMTKLLRTLENI